MKKSISILILMIIGVSVLSAQTGKKKSLIVSNCEATESICDTQHVFRYDFIDGEFVSKEKIITTETLDIRFDLGANQIYQNRYLINEWGEIFDLTTKEFILKERGNFVEAIGDDVIYYANYSINDVDVEGVFVFNLKTRKYQKLADADFWEYNDKVLSPDKKHLAVSKNESDEKTSYVNLVIYELENLKIKKKIVFDAALPFTGGANHFDWIDNENLVTYSSLDHTIYKIDILTKKVEKIVKILVKENPPSFSRPNRKYIVSKDNGTAIYHTDDQDFVVDLKNKTYSTGLLPIGNGFEKKYEDDYWKAYYYQGKLLGKTWSTGWALSSEDYLVVEFYEVKKGEFLNQPKGIKVWSKAKKDWTTIEIKWGLNVIGWIEN